MFLFAQGAAFMKAALPFVDPAARERLGLLIQASELADSVEQASDMPLSACDFQESSVNLEGLLSAFLPLCGVRERALLEQLLTMLRLRKFLNIYQSVSSSDNTSAGMMDILLQQLAPEQREAFLNYQSIFEAMNP